jgi:hypothetical protein
MSFLLSKAEQEIEERFQLQLEEPPPSPGFFDGSLDAIGTGIKRVGATAYQIAAAGAYANSFQYLDPELRVNEDFLKSLEETALNEPRRITASITPDPMTTGTGAQILYGVTSSLLPVVAAGPLGAAGMAATGGGFMFTGTASDLAEQGVDPATAIGGGLIDGLFQAGGIALPAAFSKNVLRNTLLYGPAANVAQSVVAQKTLSSYLESRGYDQLADHYGDVQAAAVAADIVLGAAFGYLGARGANIPASARDRIPPPSQDQRDAASVALDSKHIEIDTAPEFAADDEALRAHIARINLAIEQLVAGQPVNIDGVDVKGETVPRPDLEGQEQVIVDAFNNSGLANLVDEIEVLTAELERRGIPTTRPGEEGTVFQDIGGRDPETAVKFLEQSPIRVTDEVRRIIKSYEKFGDPEGVIFRLRNLQAALEERAVLREAKKGADRVRGDLWVRERFARAARTGEISQESYGLITYLLDKNPNIANDLALSFRVAERGAARGTYNPVERLVTIFTNRANDETAVHEVLHHIERMLPENLRTKIRMEWLDALDSLNRKARKNKDEQTMVFLDNVIKSLGGDQAARVAVEKAIRDGKAPALAYQYTSPSEWWAVNGSRIIQDRANRDGWVQSVKQFLKEFLEKAKAAFGLDSNAAVIRALDEIGSLEGTLRGEMLAPADGVEIAQLDEDRGIGTHIIGAERGERVVAKKVTLSDAEKSAIKQAAKDAGIPEKEINAVVRSHKAAHPRSDGWAALEFTGVRMDEVEDGPPKLTYLYKTIPYAFNTNEAGKSLKKGTPEYTARVNSLAARMREEVRAVFQRALSGDAAAKNIIKQAGWYKEMRSRLRQEFGGLGDLFADLLGATSPNTPVRGNWSNAIDAMRRAMRGDFDELMPKWIAWVDNTTQKEAEFRAFFDEQLAAGKTKKAIKEMPEYARLKGEVAEARKLPDDLMPLKETGKKYGFNGRNVVRALVDLWRVVKDPDADIGRGGTAPKAINFSGNLIGFREKATIDVWAARMLQRLAGLLRIPSMAEGGVSGEMRATGETTLQFGFGQDVFNKAAKDIREDAELATDKNLSTVNDDDLQAIVWFLEKEIWTRNNWTSAAGEGGSFEFEADLTGSAEQARITELRRVADSAKSSPDQKAAAIAELETLVRPAERYQAGISIQQAVGTQGVDFIPTDADQAALANRVQTAIYENDDGATVLGSKVLSTQGRYGDIERSLDVEAVVREGYDPSPLMLRLLREAQNALQDSMFLSRVLRTDEDPDPLVHRPGVEIYFRDAKAIENMQPLLDDLKAQGVEFYTVVVDAKRLPEAMAGAMPAAVGVRFQYIPEFDVRYGDDAMLRMTDEELTARIREKELEMDTLADRVMREVKGITFAQQLWYATDVRFSSEYQGAIDALASRAIETEGGAPRADAWDGRPIRQGIEAAARQLREPSRAEAPAKPGDVVGIDAAQRLIDAASPENGYHGLQVVDADGSFVKAADAMDQADAAIVKAEEESTAFPVAVTCFLRNG